MDCLSPLNAYRGPVVTPGKLNIVWNRKDSLRGQTIDLPCGQCIECKLERSRQWAVRIVHESQLHPENSFITLTYAPKNMPFNSTLDLSDFQLFMKRLRKANSDRKIRFFHCGEYGEKKHRPHYHAIIFNLAFADQQHYKTSDAGNKLYTSATLEKIWGLGFATVGPVTFETAAYCARYLMKKITGGPAENHYYGRKPEYTTMSRRRGIGYEWYQKFKSDVYPSDEVVMRGRAMKPPKFYDNILDTEHPDMLYTLKEARIKRALIRKAKETVFNPKRLNEHRLTVKERCKSAQISALSRPLE